MPITIVAGQSLQVDVEMEPLGQNAEIWGYVFDAVAAIGGALVQLIGQNSYSEYTGLDGYYKISPVVPGQYSLIVSKQGYATKSL